MKSAPGRKPEVFCIHRSILPSRSLGLYKIFYGCGSAALRCWRAGLLVAVITASAFGQISRDTAKENAIVDRLQKIAPGAVKDFQSGTTAMDAADYAAAAVSYQKVLALAPDFDPALRRAGISLAYSGHVTEGRAQVEKALAKNRSPENLITLAEVLAYAGDGQAARGDKQRALGLAREAAALEIDSDPTYPTTLAQLSLDTQSEADFRSATETLSKTHPELMQTHYFKAIRAAMDEKWGEAEDEIRTAGRLGLPAQTVQAFLDTGVHSRASIWQYAYYVLYLLIAWVLGLVALFVLGRVLSSLTLRSIETDDPNDAQSHKHHLLRQTYRRLINVAGFYYYISVPFVIFLVVGAAAGVTYGFVQLGHVPIGWIAMLAIGAVVTSYKMVHTLFIRREQEDPGRVLKREEAPEFWDLARDVAGRVGTRPVDEIRVTPGTDLAVYERGSFKDRARDKGHRILILGVATLNGFSQNAFRAVLAHEYGHLSHRDTAGGDVALRVNANMREFAIAMLRAGQAVWWNLAFHFLRIYHFIFRRLSHGATRLQEVLADRTAVLNYGAEPFEEGLRHIIRRSIEFEDIAYWEFADAKQGGRQLQNLYELDCKNLNTIEEKFNEAINRPTTQDDTHPGPIDRFRYAARIVSSNVDPAPGMVWDLFKDQAGLTKEMSDKINKGIRTEL